MGARVALWRPDRRGDTIEIPELQGFVVPMRLTRIFRDVQAAGRLMDDHRAFLRALPEHMFRCLEDAQCAVVQGWCATFAINRANLATYDQIPPDPNGKGARGCPPGWVPPLPRAVCEAKLCKVVSSRPEQAP